MTKGKNKKKFLEDSPSPKNIFWFDAGRSYQTGVLSAMVGGPKEKKE